MFLLFINSGYSQNYPSGDSIMFNLLIKDTIDIENLVVEGNSIRKDSNRCIRVKYGIEVKDSAQLFLKNVILEVDKNNHGGITISDHVEVYNSDHPRADKRKNGSL